VNILVTGASGFVGGLLTSRIIDRNPRDKVAIFLLPTEAVPAGLEGKVEVLRGDLRDSASVREAVKGRDFVYHIAGYISYWVLDAGIMEAVNVGGVRAIVDACIEFKVKRLVHVSSVGAIGFYPDGREADETTSFNWPESFGYMTTKRDGQRIVQEAVRERGLDAVIVNPASVMGPGDPVPGSAHNRLYGNMYKVKTFIGTFGGGLAIVDVRDLVDTILAAGERGRPGEAYLSVGANVPYSRVLELMAQYSGRKFVPLVVPGPLLVAAGWVAELFSRLTRKRPLITLAYGQLSSWVAYYSSEKSRRELGVSYRPLEETIADGCGYYEEKVGGKKIGR
jgi:Nucleoside-diphosphate-sugar epimerases